MAKPWSKDHPCCLGCGLTTAPHYAKGRCKRCYRAWHHKLHPDVKHARDKRYRLGPNDRVDERKARWEAAHPGRYTELKRAWRARQRARRLAEIGGNQNGD